MNREILFRGKRLDSGEWVSGGSLVKLNSYIGGEEYFMPQKGVRNVVTIDENYNIICFENCIFYKVITETVGQYTGLTDKNGKKIFEGDIVKVKTSSNDGTTVEITRVGYDIKFCSFFPMSWEESCDGCDCYFRIEEIEIIGNIHDNPELLKGGVQE